MLAKGNWNLTNCLGGLLLLVLSSALSSYSRYCFAWLDVFVAEWNAVVHASRVATVVLEVAVVARGVIDMMMVLRGSRQTPTKATSRHLPLRQRMNHRGSRNLKLHRRMGSQMKMLCRQCQVGTTLRRREWKTPMLTKTWRWVI